MEGVIVELLLFVAFLGKTSQIKHIKRTRLVMCTFELDTDPALAAVLRIKVARHMIQVHQTIIPNCKIPTMPVWTIFYWLTPRKHNM